MMKNSLTIVLFRVWQRPARGRITLVRLFGIFALLLLFGDHSIEAEVDLKRVGEVRTLYAHAMGIEQPDGLAYSANLNQFFWFEKGGSTQVTSDEPTITVFTPYEEVIATFHLPVTMADASLIAFDDAAHRLLLLKRDLMTLVQIDLDSNGALAPATATFFTLAHIGIKSAQGVAIDAKGKALFILDSAAAQIVVIPLHAQLEQVAFAKVDLPAAVAPLTVQGITVNPSNHHLYIIQPNQQLLYELTQAGQLVAQYDIAPLQLTNPLALVFAPSADLTDDASTLHLFVADNQAVPPPENQPSLLQKLYLPFVVKARPTGAEANSTSAEPPALYSKLVEVALDVAGAELSAAASDALTLNLVRTTLTSQFSPPSPDPSGLAYLPASRTLLISDGEVDEMAQYFTGKSLFNATLSGAFVEPLAASFSDEPVGADVNPVNGHLFLSDDTGTRAVYELNPGADGLYGTADDIVTFFKTSAFASKDPEGLAYDPRGAGALYIVDGTNREVYRVVPGANGIFNGVPPTGDDQVTQFDTLSLGLDDPEGGAFNPVTGNLYLVGKPSTTVFEVTTTGVLVQTYNIAAANARKPAGLAYGPSSQNPAQASLYIVDRGVDNDSNPNENDGKVYEFSFGQPFATPTNTPGSTPTKTPTPTNTPGSTPTKTPTPTNTPGSTNTPVATTTPTPTDTKTPVNTPAATTTSTATSTATSTPIPNSGDIIFVSSTSSGSVGGITFADEDVLVYDTSTDTWALYFDGSDVGLGSLDVDGFAHLEDGYLLFSFTAEGNVGALGLVDDSDIVRFIPSSLGPVTAGTFEWYFDGSSVGLTTNGEDIDAIAVLSDGSLVLSTLSSVGVSGAAGLDEDLLRFVPTELGDATNGAWSFYFDGSDVGLDTNSSGDLTGAWIDPTNGDIYLTTNGGFTIPGASNDGSDIFICTPGTIGDTTTCAFALYWNGSANDFAGEVIDAVDIDKGAQQVSSATVTTMHNIPHAGEGDDPDADPDEGPDVAEPVQDQQLFLPFVSR